MRKLLLALTILCFASPALAQNTQCTNRPIGDSTNACANTRFVGNNTVLTTTLEAYGGGCSVADNGPAFNLALANSFIAINLRACIYTVITPVVTTGLVQSVVGQGKYNTRINYAPTADATLFTIGSIAAETSWQHWSDFGIVSSDTTHTKTAFNFIDTSEVQLRNIACTGPTGTGARFIGGTGSICLQTNGRDLSTFELLEFGANKPIILADNPTLSLSTDHFVFRDIYLVGDSGAPCVTVTAPVSNLSFLGRQSLAGCAGGYKFNPSVTYPGVAWNNLAIENPRIEQQPTPGIYDIDINATGDNLRGLFINNGQVTGIKLRTVLSGTISNMQSSCTAPFTNFLDINTTDDQIYLSNNRLEAACTMSPSSGTPMTAVQASVNPTGSVIPAEARFYSAAHTFSFTGETSTGNAAAGVVGEYIESLITGSPVSIVTNTPKNLTSITLSAGDWDVETYIVFNPDTTTSVSNAIASISLVTNTLSFAFVSHPTAAFVPNVNISLATTPIRFSVAGSTIVYSVAYSTFTVSTMAVTGLLRARRVR